MNFHHKIQKTTLLRASILRAFHRASKYLILRPGARKTFRLSSRLPRIHFNVLSRT